MCVSTQKTKQTWLERFPVQTTSKGLNS